MDDDADSTPVAAGAIKAVKLSIASESEIRTFSINECPISHPGQLSNPFLGLPLQSGRCESCGTADHGKCEGHFGYIELPVPVYHPSHVAELGQVLSLICLKCLRMKKGKVKRTNGKESVSASQCFYCRDVQLLVKVAKTNEEAFYLELKVGSRKHLHDGFWNFLDRFGFHHGGRSNCRPLLPQEALNILKGIPEETIRKVNARGYFPQTGYIMQYLPAPPNCLYNPEVSDGIAVMSYDISRTLLKKILSKIENIKRSRSGDPNFESHAVEAHDLQLAISQYIHLRGTTSGPQDTKRYTTGTTGKDAHMLSSRQWLDKIKTLFISKGSSFSSRSVITGDSYIGINTIGIPREIAKRVTFEERVTEHNLSRMQDIVDKQLCVTYKDGSTSYSLSLGSKGHTFLKRGQIINRTIMDGDLVFLNRPPSTHKHSVQAFRVFIHDGNTVKINPLICGPLGADFDGDCIHLFYPQSLAARAEALELFSVEKQLICSHTGDLNLQLVHDSLLGLKVMIAKSFWSKEAAQQLVMFACPLLSQAAVYKCQKFGQLWTTAQILQSALPTDIDCFGEKHSIVNGEVINLDSDRDSIQSTLTDVVSSILFMKNPNDCLGFLNLIQPLLMEILFLDGFSISLKDFAVPKDILEEVQRSIQRLSYIDKSRSSPNQLVEFRVESHLKMIKQPIIDFILKSSSIGLLIDSKSDSAITKVVQQLGFLGLQLYPQGKLYSERLVDEFFSTFIRRFSSVTDECPPEAYGLLRTSYIRGLNPFEALVHSLSVREAVVRSSRGLTEPGTLFKNLMAILRDIVICYDGTVRNTCSNSIIQYEYVDSNRADYIEVSPPGEPVGVLAATAVSHPAYKAVLDSSRRNNTSWEQMKEILLTRTNYKNVAKDRTVILFLNDCFCGKKFCKERAAIAVQRSLKRVKLEDCVTEIFIEYQSHMDTNGTSDSSSHIVGHIHLDKLKLNSLSSTSEDILRRCEETIQRQGKKKRYSNIFKNVALSASESCSTQQTKDSQHSEIPCLQFYFTDQNTPPFEEAVQDLLNVVCPVILDTIIKGDPRIDEAKIVWIGTDAPSWVRNSGEKLKGEPAVEIVVEQDVARENGDAWRTAIDACIPLINLINTQRSIPYGIQQIRELLGISCAFDQAVQRLSASVRSVEKSVLKDHLIVVANSMTCTGKLNGFNSGGYKATFQALKVQVPFTESTLFTPMKCFERAAEKCHVDLLGSVVSSCSWGKPAAVGTGSSFEVFWDQQQMVNNESIGEGLYYYLEMLTPSRNRERKNQPYEDIDYLGEESDVSDPCMSPEIDGLSAKPTFEDDFEINSSGWKNNSSWNQGETWEKTNDAANEDDSWKAGNSNSNWSKKTDKTASEVNKWNSWGNEQNASCRSDKSNPADATAEYGSWNIEKNNQIWSEKNDNTGTEVEKSKTDDDWGNAVAPSFKDAANHHQNKGVSAAKSGGGWGSLGASPLKDMTDRLWEPQSQYGHADGGNSWAASTRTNDEWGTTAASCSKDKDNGQWSSSENSVLGRYSGTGGVCTSTKRGWKSDSWGGKPNNPPKQKNFSGRPPRRPDGNNHNPGLSRQPFNLTPEEEVILFEVEPLVRNVRRIIRESSDGERISPDDEKFILEKVFEYHPNKDSKAAGLDHFKVDKHESFKDNRCFYVVTSDGTSVDFSYRKCLSNFVLLQFPEHGEGFNKKYFRKPAQDRVSLPNIDPEPNSEVPS